MAGNPRGTAPSGAGALTLALSHQGRGDTLVGIWGWFRAAILDERFWIPAFAGMTAQKSALGRDGG